MAKEFNKVEDLKQIKPDYVLTLKCQDIIDGLKGFTKNEKYRILSTLYDSFMDVCKQGGIAFLEVQRLL